MEKKEVSHHIYVLGEVIRALKSKNSLALKALSNQVIHTSCSEQELGSINLAVIVYALSKLIEREDDKRIPNWELFQEKIIDLFSQAESFLEKEDITKYSYCIKKARKTLESASPKLKPYIQEVLRKASINKASKLYEHGLSLGKTSELFGLTQWDLSDYAAQKAPQLEAALPDESKRAKLALEFFS